MALTRLRAGTALIGSIADARIPASAVSQHATSFDDNKLVNDISSLALREASNNDRAAYNTNSSYVDVFQDASGIDTTTNVFRSPNEYISSIVSTGLYSGNFASGYLKYPANSDYALGTGDFTVEWWQKTSSSGNNQTGVYGTTNQAAWTTDGWHVGYYDSKLTFGYNSQGPSNEFTVSNSHDNNWHHMAVVRDNGTLRAYRDGVASGTTASNSISLGNASFNIAIGAHEPNGGGPFTGYIDDFRLSNSCRYPNGTTFTPHTSAHISDANTMILLSFEDSDFPIISGVSATSRAKTSATNVTQIADVNNTDSATGNFTGTTITAPSSVSSMGAIITYQDNAGTNALNTDIVLQLSADGGSNYSTATLTALPDFSTGIKMAKVNDLAVTAGTNLKYKISFANQASGSKEARIRGVSLQY